MSSEIDPSTLAGTALAELIKSSFQLIAGPVSKKTKAIYDTMFQDFSPYMEECYRRNRFVRILSQGDDDVDLLSIYVETKFSHNNKLYNDRELAWQVSEGRNLIVVGAGGAGKTFFLKKLWLDLLAEGVRAPIFLELRKLGDIMTPDLIAFMRFSISGNMDETTFHDACERGRFIFILDGFDELPKDRHEALQDQIIALSEKYPKCRVIVSGRPDGRFHGWSNFRMFDAEPFSLGQTTELCRKIPFDSEYRKKFLERLNEKFYNEYMSFLSNPLLAVMMMMTFRRNMDIPRNMGIFYDEAFGTLYQWHDSTKAFKRKKNLDIQEFRRSFGTFCLLSYMQEKFDFSRTELDDYIEKSTGLTGLTQTKEQILDDYERNVNVIRQDGLRYYFIHRSFQEYFSAWALTNVFQHKFSDLSSRLEKRHNDSVIRMCHDLQRSLVIKEYIGPRYRALAPHFTLPSRGSENEVWTKSIKSLRIHIAHEDKNQDVEVEIGVGIDLDYDIGMFLRNCYKMSRGIDSPDYFLGLVDPVFSYSKLAREWFSKFNVEWGDENDSITVLPDFSAGTVELSVTAFCNHKMAVRLDEAALEMLSKISLRAFEVLSNCGEWCRKEIAFLENSDKAVEDIFGV